MYEMQKKFKPSSQEMFGILYYFNPRVSDNCPILIYCVHQISAWS